jgi:GNAT superfamily N-acetyltransferase
MSATDRITLRPAELTRDRAALLQLNTEYMSWVMGQLEVQLNIQTEQALGMPLPDYVAQHLDEICHSPGGRFYLAYLGGDLAGMGGLRALTPEMGDLKRIYLRPARRGQGLGEALVKQLIGDARSLGLKQLCLDSAPFMAAAHRLYRNHGFRDCGPYPGTEAPEHLHPHWRFMALELR